MDRCPRDQTLRDLLADRLPVESAPAVETHVEACAKCQQMLEKLIDVPLPFSAGSMGSRQPPSEADAAFLQRLEKSPVKRDRSDPHRSMPVPEGGEGGVTELSGYEILEVLGQGGMGVVYKAWQKQLRRLVAIKMVLASRHAGTEDLARFRIEAEAAARLQHPNIVQVHEVAEANGLPFLVLEFVDGSTLSRTLQGVSLEAVPAAHLVETLARAMHYSHQRGIIHRDLKPSNILVQKRGGDTAREKTQSESTDPSIVLRPSAFTPKIADFGLAKLTVGGSDRTRTGSIVGTPSYMAPEQAGGRTKEITTAVDVYALGAILFELLTGKPPFLGDTVAQTLQQVLTEEPVPPRRLQSSVPRDLETICLRCLEKDPRRRYSSAQDLAEDLRRFQADEPILAKPSSVGRRLWKWAKRRPAAAALVVAIVLGSAALLAEGLWYQRELEKSLAEVTLERDKASAARKDAVLKSAVAEEQRDAAERNLYLADIPLAFRAWNAAHVGQMNELLDAIGPHALRPKDLRHFEWHYLRRLPHNHVQILKGHAKAAVAVAFRPGGMQLASGGADGAIRIWDADTGRESVSILDAHSGKVASVAFSPDGKRLASAGADRRICLWNPDDGKLLRLLGTHDGNAYHVGFRPDGKILASSGEDQSVKLWDLERGGEPIVLRGQTKAVAATAFSLDGKRLASVGADFCGKLWDLENPGEPRTFAIGHTGWVYSVAFSPDGKTLFTSSFDDTVRAWDAATGKERAEMTMLHSGQVRGMALSGDGARIASASYDQSVRIWDAANGAMLLRLKGHIGKVYAVAFHPNGRRVASAGDDRTVRIWDVSGPQEFHPGPKHDSSPVNMVAFSPDNRLLVSGGADGAIQAWDSILGKQERPFRGHTGSVHAAAFLADGSLLATGGADRVIRLWDVMSRETVETFKGHTGRVSSLAVGDGIGLVSASFDGTVRIWRRSGRNDSRILGKHVGRARGVAISPDGKLVASCGDDQKAVVWDSATGTKHRDFEGHTGYVHCVAFSPDGKSLASGGADGAIIVWDLTTGEKRFVMEGHAGRVSSIAFTRDGQRLASIGFFDKLIKIWDTTRGQELLALNHQTTGYAVAFSPRGSLLASAGADPTVRIWDGTPLP